ncbi:hypothetical protein [Bosea minatitlanensis]|uniref:HK97 gp10 family phage protein n=1 Tax=Bosea minatitlanensis TaxID=128782 RepID=A0ABW0EZH6_9HYPH|nr:hypothetical protein [Bosea minatitlanensis]MCT4492715.1 hypothetical protein [Bosea minatitlanensis]
MAVKGADSVAGVLRRLAGVPTSAQARGARVRALKPVVEDAKTILAGNGSVITGKLRRAMGTGEKDRNTTAAGPRKGMDHTNVAHLVEFGTLAHPIVAKNAPNLVFTAKDGRKVVTKSVSHPGAKPYPFMRPAFERNKELVIQNLGKELVGVIEKAAKGRER